MIVVQINSLRAYTHATMEGGDAIDMKVEYLMQLVAQLEEALEKTLGYSDEDSIDNLRQFIHTNCRRTT